MSEPFKFRTVLNLFRNKCSHPGFGTVFGAIAGLFYACSSAVVKTIEGKVDAITVFTCRSAVLLMFSIIIILVTRRRFWIYEWTDYLTLSASTSLAVFAIVLQYKAYEFISLSTSFTIMACTPIFIAFISFVFRCKDWKATDSLVIILCIIGVVLCAQPDFIFRYFDEDARPSTLGIGMVVLAAFARAVTFFGFRKVRHIDVPSKLFIQFSLTMVPVLVLYFAIGQQKLPEGATDVFYLILNGCFSLAAVLFFYLSVMIDSPQLAAIGRSSDIVVSFAFDVILFNSPFNWIAVLGSFFVMLSIIVPPILTVITDS